MGVPYGWFLHRSFSREEVLAFVETVPNAGITEFIDGAWVDVYLADGAVKVDPAHVEELVDLLERGGSGTYSYEVASALQLAFPDPAFRRAGTIRSASPSNSRKG